MTFDYCIEPVDKLKMKIQRTVRTAETNQLVCVMNISDSCGLLQKRSQLGTAYLVESYLGSNIVASKRENHIWALCGTLVLSFRLFSCWLVPVFLT
jgi:hypothetical protein